MMMTTAELICAAILAMSMPNAEFACKHMDAVVKYSEKYSIEPVLLTAVIYAESGWNPKAESKAGACGLTQVIPKWTRKFGYVSCRRLKRDPEMAIRKGAQILNYWINKYNRGNVRLGLCGYNAGYRCRDKNKILDKRGHTRYTRRVLKIYREIELEMTPGCMYRE
jgi:soluble lytic murein transglycosylase-like protein